MEPRLLVRFFVARTRAFYGAHAMKVTGEHLARVIVDKDTISDSQIDAGSAGQNCYQHVGQARLVRAALSGRPDP